MPVACGICSEVAYCSKDCKDKGESFHKYECGKTQVLSAENPAFLAVRLVTALHIDKDHETKQAVMALCSAELSSEEKLDMAAQALYVANTLEEMKYPANKETLLGLLFEVLCKIRANSHEISQLHQVNQTFAGTLKLAV